MRVVNLGWKKTPVLFQKISPNLPLPQTLLANRGQLSMTFIDYYHSKYITESFLHDREQDTYVQAYVQQTENT